MKTKDLFFFKASLFCLGVMVGIGFIFYLLSIKDISGIIMSGFISVVSALFGITEMLNLRLPKNTTQAKATPKITDLEETKGS